MAEETMNLMTVSIRDFTRLIKEDLDDEIYTPFIGIGKSGVGKTMCIAELCKERGIGFCELRLVTLTETDLIGIPDIVTDENGVKRTTYASNELLPVASRDGEEGILVLDEITSASANIRAAAYQLLDSKRALGNYKLPPKWKVVALGNGPDDGGVFNGMEHAFLSRAMSYRIEPELDVWESWAVRNGVNSSVIAFLKFAPDKIHVFDPDEMACQFPCPRSWTTLSTKLNKREERKGGILDENDVTLLAAGTVGAAVASEFSAFYNYNKDTISAEDIMNGKANTDISGYQSEVMYLVIQSLIKSLAKELNDGTDRAKSMEHTVNTCNWLIDISKQTLDYAITGIRSLAENVPKFCDIVISDEFDEKCPRLIEFAGEVGIILSPID